MTPIGLISVVRGHCRLYCFWGGMRKSHVAEWLLLVYVTYSQFSSLELETEFHSPNIRQIKREKGPHCMSKQKGTVRRDTVCQQPSFPCFVLMQNVRGHNNLSRKISTYI
jgi:hypothetical protein